MKTIVIVIVVIVLIAGGFYLYKNNQAKTTVVAPTTQTQTQEKMQTVPPSEAMMSPEPSGAAMKAETGTTKEFTVTGKPFSFTPSTLTVKKGDTVKITFKNAQGMHNFVLDEFNVKSKTINAGEEDTVTFVADKAGAFEYYCGIGNHRAMGMKGTLTVQ